MLDFRRSLGSPRKETKSVRERSAGSFPEQRRVIEPTIYNVLVKLQNDDFWVLYCRLPHRNLSSKITASLNTASQRISKLSSAVMNIERWNFF